MRNDVDADVDVVYEQCTNAEYRTSLAVRGLPDFFVEDMSQNMRYIAEYGFLLETFAGWVKGDEFAALR